MDCRFDARRRLTKHSLNNCQPARGHAPCHWHARLRLRLRLRMRLSRLRWRTLDVAMHDAERERENTQEQREKRRGNVTASHCMLSRKLTASEQTTRGEETEATAVEQQHHHRQQETQCEGCFYVGAHFDDVGEDGEHGSERAGRCEERHVAELQRTLTRHDDDHDAKRARLSAWVFLLCDFSRRMGWEGGG